MVKSLFWPQLDCVVAWNLIVRLSSFDFPKEGTAIHTQHKQTSDSLFLPGRAVTFLVLIDRFSLRAPYSSYGDGKEHRPRSRSPHFGRDGREPRDGRDGRDGRDPGREPRPSSHSRDPDYRYRGSNSREKDFRNDPREPAYRWRLLLGTFFEYKSFRMLLLLN